MVRTLSFNIPHTDEMIQAIGDETIVIAMEEFAELTQQASKLHRGKEDTDALCEEIADALVGVSLLIEQSGATEERIQEWIDFKCERTRGKIRNGEFK